MNKDFVEGFMKIAAKIMSLKTPSFGKSMRGSAFAMPSKTIKADLANFKPPKGNATQGYQSGSTKGIKTNLY